MLIGPGEKKNAQVYQLSQQNYANTYNKGNVSILSPSTELKLSSFILTVIVLILWKTD